MTTPIKKAEVEWRIRSISKNKIKNASKQMENNQNLY